MVRCDHRPQFERRGFSISGAFCSQEHCRVCNLPPVCLYACVSVLPKFMCVLYDVTGGQCVRL